MSDELNSDQRERTIAQMKELFKGMAYQNPHTPSRVPEQPTLRDRFAISAMNAYIGEISFGVTEKGILYPKHDLIATYSYEMADAMIKARKEGGV